MFQWRIEQECDNQTILKQNKIHWSIDNYFFLIFVVICLHWDLLLPQKKSKSVNKTNKTTENNLMKETIHFNYQVGKGMKYL